MGGSRLHSSNSMPSFASQHDNTPRHTANGHTPNCNASHNGNSNSTTATKAGSLFGGSDTGGMEIPGSSPGSHYPPHHQGFAAGEEALMPHAMDGLAHGQLDDPLGLGAPPKSEGVDAFLDMFLDNAHGNGVAP